MSGGQAERGVVAKRVIVRLRGRGVGLGESVKGVLTLIAIVGFGAAPKPVSGMQSFPLPSALGMLVGVRLRCVYGVEPTISMLHH